MTIETPRILALFASGAGLLRRYTGTLAVLYAIGALMSAVVYFVTTLSLSAELSKRPRFDRGVTGDLVALAQSLSAHTDLLSGLALVGVGVVALYLALSWFLAAGLIGVLCRRPYGRREVARQFGESGAIGFLGFARLALWSVIPWIAILVVAGFGIAWSGVDDALTGRELLARIVPALTPAALLAWWVSTVVAYARVHLVRDPALASWRALVGAARLVSSRPRLLLHAATYPLIFALLTAGYLVLTDRTVIDSDTALALWFIRQVTVAARLAAKVWILAGQVEAAKEIVPIRR